MKGARWRPGLTRPPAAHARPFVNWGVLAALLAASVPCAVPAQPAEAPLRWYKGNTHTHTLNSDGDSSPDDVARWYRAHGYQVLVLSDHNVLTSPDVLNALFGMDEQFLLIPGEEVTDRVGEKPLHMNRLLVNRVVAPQGGATMSEALQRNVDAIRAAGGLPHLNHPNFGWAVTAADLKRVERDRLFEIYNGHPLVNNEGGGGMPSMEEVWDDLLSSGKLLYGLATDDAHHFLRPWDPMAARPGRGWLMVRARRLEAREIVSAIERGDFYASTGVTLTSYEATAREVRLSVRVDGTTRFRVRFIGRDGTTLAEASSSPAVYVMRGDEGYVRARGFDSNGLMAWTQPVMLPIPRRAP